MVAGLQAQPRPHSSAPNGVPSQPLQLAPLDSGFGPLDTTPPDNATPQQIVTQFAAKESRFKIARNDYTYRRTVKLDTLNEDGVVDGEYLQADDIVFSPTGRKHELVVYAPDNTLTRIAMSPSDFDDLEHRLPFSLTTEDIDQYRVSYVGKQRVDQVATYVFDVAPRQILKDHRYFIGRIWVDAKDDQIVVTNGKNIPDNTRRGQEDLSPPFTTYRQQIDGKYWFPVYTKAEGTLHFQGCKECLPNDVHIREIVKYGDYKRFGTNVQIVYRGLNTGSAATPSSGQSPATQSANSHASGSMPPTGSVPPQAKN
ncbi:MAG: hypothetical protein ACYDC6_14365 [Acidobacteriaceae bacterium]